MTRFYKLTSEEAKFLRDNLTLSEWKLWSYLVTIDPFGDKYLDLPPTITILGECNISKPTFYRTIAKFQALEMFDFQDNGFTFRNLANSAESHPRDNCITHETTSITHETVSIYQELQTNQTLSEAKEKIDTIEIDTATNGPHSSAIATIEPHSLAKIEFSPVEKFSEVRTTKTVQQRNFNWLPEGPWNLEGKLDPNFRDFVANDWLKRFGGDIHSKRADVLGSVLNLWNK